MKSIERKRFWGKGGLLLGNVLDDGVIYETHLGGWAPDVLKYANMEDALGLLHPAMFQTAAISELPMVPASKTVFGYVEKVLASNGPCELTGWAVLPKRRRVADCVVVAYHRTGDQPTIFAVMDQVSDRTFVAQAFHRRELLHCGWSVHFQRSAIPPGEQHISAFALDTKVGVFYELGGAHTLP